MIDKQSLLNRTFNKLTNKDNTYHFFLFEELMIYCKEQKRARDKSIGYRFKGLIPVNMIVVKDHVVNFGDAEGMCNPVEQKKKVKVMNIHSPHIIFAEMKHAWELVRMDSQKTFVMMTKSLEEKERWINLIVELIQAKAARAKNYNPEAEKGRVPALQYEPTGGKS
jgi:hypothetical protein